MAAAPARAQIDGLEIIAPANPGSGFDQTSRAVQEALQQGGLAKGVQVVNIPGAGGTIGLAQLVTAKKPGASLLTIGVTTVGAILTNKPPITLDDAHPLALLLREYSLVVVPANSDVKTVADLAAKVKADPATVRWGVGSAGGVDHVIAGQFTKAVGADPRKLNAIHYPGGGEQIAAIMGGVVTVGVGGVPELASQIKSGKIRALAVSSRRAPSRSRRPDAQGAGRQCRHRHVARADGSQAGHGCREEGAGRRHREDGGDASLEEHARTIRLARRLSGFGADSVRS